MIAEHVLAGSIYSCAILIMAWVKVVHGANRVCSDFPPYFSIINPRNTQRRDYLSARDAPVDSVASVSAGMVRVLLSWGGSRRDDSV